MSSPDEQLDPQAVQDDRSAIAKELEKVSDDGYSRVDEQKSQEQIEQEAPAGEEIASQPESQSVPSEGSQEEAQQPAGESAQEAQAGEQVQPTQEQLDDYEREVEGIQPPKGASTRTTEVLKIVKQKAREEHRIAKERAKEIEALKAREFIDDNLKKEIEDLRSFRGNFAIQQDLNQKYIPQIQQHEAQAVGLMRQHGLPEETAKFIGEQGGILRVRDSEVRMPIGTQDLEGRPFVGTQSDWYKNVVEPLMNESLPSSVKTKINFHMNKAYEALSERDDAFAKARSNPQQYFQDQQEKNNAQIKDWTERADKQLVKESDIYGEISKPKEIPTNATKEQIDEIKAHNANLEDAQNYIKQTLSDITPENMVSMATAKAYRDKFFFPRIQALEVENKSLKAKNAEWEQKWNKAKNVAQTTRQQATVKAAPERRVEESDPLGEKNMRRLMEQVPA